MLTYRTDMDRHALAQAMGMRGVMKDQVKSNWLVYWASVHACRMLFHVDSGVVLGDEQRVNHFPNHSELTRKDLLAKNLRRR